MLCLSRVVTQDGGAYVLAFPPSSDSSPTPSHLPAQVVAHSGLDASVRQAAAVSFKNHVKYHWVGVGVGKGLGNGVGGR